MARTNRAVNCSAAIQRLKQDYMRLCRDPVPFVRAEPLPSNMFEWHYVIFGPSDSPYKGGYYHGKLIFPSDFPFRPPSIYMITPNGRFSCNTSDFHPDTWNPAWSISSILTGLLSFMLENTCTSGSIVTSLSTKKQLAKVSGEFNLKSEVFCELFPELVKEIRDELCFPEQSTSMGNKNDDCTSPSLEVLNSGLGIHIHNRNDWHISKIFVLVVVSIFAFLVKIVLCYLEQPLM